MTALAATIHPPRPASTVGLGDNVPRYTSYPTAPHFHPGVDAVTVRGEARKDLASLTVELGVELLGKGPAWVPVGRDDAVLTMSTDAADTASSR